MSENKLVYICSPYAGDIERNVEFAKTACRYAMRQNCTPVAVHLLYPQLLDDSEPVQRQAGIRMGLRVLEAVDELWCCGDQISAGMCAEIAAAKRLEIPVKEIPESEIQGGIDMEQYGVWAVRSANSVCGAAQSWCKHNGEPIKFDTYEQAAAHAKSLNENAYSPNVHYYPKEMEPELKQSPGMSMKL
ncbi:DUF4406 domain-containing protein [Marasmitruncus massiliensis]|uniref:DUF7768 domain-containing protein n=1 Tax=Marasmitruncus massiliensis TaxID=1944642 RepID=UPI000C79F9C0|nr:DUF4406 domain-containing protein [Marasmitruncus massiliensis]